MLMMLENGIGSDVMISDASWCIQCPIYNYMYMYTYYIYTCEAYVYLQTYTHTHIYIYFFSTIISLNPPNPQKSQKMKVWKCIFRYYFLYKKVHFEKVTKGTPLGGFLSQNNLHVSTQLINTLSPHGLILLIISALLHALITWQSYEPHFKSHESNFVVFFSLFGGVDLLQQRVLGIIPLDGRTRGTQRHPRHISQPGFIM
jgi:hypothetical protein